MVYAMSTNSTEAKALFFLIELPKLKYTSNIQTHNLLISLIIIIYETVNF